MRTSIYKEKSNHAVFLWDQLVQKTNMGLKYITSQLIWTIRSSLRIETEGGVDWFKHIYWMDHFIVYSSKNSRYYRSKTCLLHINVDSNSCFHWTFLYQDHLSCLFHYVSLWRILCGPHFNQFPLSNGNIAQSTASFGWNNSPALFFTCKYHWMPLLLVNFKELDMVGVVCLSCRFYINGWLLYAARESKVPHL